MSLGLSAIAFTERVDHTVWTVDLKGIHGTDHLAAMAPDGLLTHQNLTSLVTWMPLRSVASGFQIFGS